MTKTATGQYTITQWSEAPFKALTPPQKANMAEIKMEFDGDLVGHSETRYLMAYVNDDTAYFNGTQHFSGELNGQQGEFVILEQGEFKDGIATSQWQIVEGSGTGALKGIVGSGHYRAGHGCSADYQLDYQLNT